jgi:thiosulfate/3-mercaptopyruvate sulfurtransferase
MPVELRYHANTVAFKTLISPTELAAIQNDALIVDTRHDLANPEAGKNAHVAGHIGGAVFMSLDHDLAGPKTGQNGRHPLPDTAVFADKLRTLGLGRGMQLVVYDEQNGMFAARLWWLARYLGHANVAVLDGGLAAWKRAGYTLSTDIVAKAAGDFVAGEPLTSAVNVSDLLADPAHAQFLVVDARAAERYRGDSEPLDRVAGHIPGALNRPFAKNLTPEGTFKSASVLREEFQALLSGIGERKLVHQCGSGVTACHNLLAMEHAGLAGAALYVGSWSEWSSDPKRPFATGDEPGN